MPKLRVSCRDCGFCEHAPGLPVGLCWRPYEGPEIVSLAPNGFCGYETRLRPQLPRDLWLALHKHAPGKLVEVLGIMRLSSATIATDMRQMLDTESSPPEWRR